MRLSILMVLAMLTGLLAALARAPREGDMSSNAPAFTLVDASGAKRSLSDYDEAPVVVLAFLGVECPLAEIYSPRLAEMANEFREDRVQFLGINSNRQDSIQEIADNAKLWGVSFPILKDPDGQVADDFDARRTPEVLVLDRQRRVTYRGRIDDQFSVGISRPAPTREDLRLAILAALEGTTVAVTQTEPAGCLIGRSHKRASKGTVTYSKHIATILDRHCIDCHREGQMAPFSLTNYEEVVGWADTIGEVVDEGRMPPWFADPHFQTYANDARLSEEEKKLIADWVADGAPLGDPLQVPPVRERSKGWGISDPDLVIAMSDAPYEVPADGVVDYQHFYADLKLTEDVWVQEAEVRPGARAVVHHIEVLILPPELKAPEGKDSASRLDIEGFTYGEEVSRFRYGAGSSAIRFPAGAAVFIPAGATLRFQIHYTPNGRVHHDISSIGFVFADPATVRHRASFGMVYTDMFLIEPNNPKFKVTAQQVLPDASYMVGIAPHMHFRGKSFRFEARYPDGSNEVLLNLSKYDFHWQLVYYFNKPKYLPKGTQLYCEAIFDNSRANPNNPDPDRAVPWGISTLDEMMEGIYGIYSAGEIEKEGAPPSPAVVGP